MRPNYRKTDEMRLAILKHCYIKRTIENTRTILKLSWKGVRDHIELFVQLGLIEEFKSIGTSRANSGKIRLTYKTTDKGRQYIELMSQTGLA